MTSKRLKLRLTNTDGASTRTVAVVQARSLQFAPVGDGSSFSVTGMVSKDARSFAGEKVTVLINIDNAEDISTCANTLGGSLSSDLRLSGAGGSSISIGGISMSFVNATFSSEGLRERMPCRQPG